MDELFEVTMMLGGMQLFVAGYETDNCVQEVVKVMALVKDTNCNKYVELFIDNKNDFKKTFEEAINEALEDGKHCNEDLAFDAWREEQAFKNMEKK